MDELGRIGPDEYKARTDHRLRLVLDDVRSRHNVGAFFRTADAFGCTGLTLCGFTPLPPHREIEKTALGATLSVPWSHVPSAVDAVKQLQAEGYSVWAVEQTTQAVPLDHWAPPVDRPLALVFGNELNGVAAEVVEACDGCLVIPQRGTKHSLNVSVCAGIVTAWVALRPL
jgi:tRNA G18 (ribose-2'-O)-methylase SpoU